MTVRVIERHGIRDSNPRPQHYERRNSKFYGVNLTGYRVTPVAFVPTEHSDAGLRSAKVAQALRSDSGFVSLADEIDDTILNSGRARSGISDF